ncbi:MAG: hypothetical protein ACYTE3_00140 [Planctomycetota bacterium]|jgi:hypothetical protein
MGFFAHEAVIHGESQADFELHREALLAEWRPVGATESMLAERIVSLSWRLRRAERMQNQATDCMILREVVGKTNSELNRSYCQANGISADDPRAADEDLPLGRIATKLWSDNPQLIERLFSHERRIENSMYKTMHELEKLQSARKAEQSRVAEQQSAHESPPAKRHRTNLKKQSQFTSALMGTKSCAGKDYDDIPPAGQRKSKPNKACPEPSRTGQVEGRPEGADAGEASGQALSGAG